MEMVCAGQLYACNSSERDEVLSLWRLVRFELVMTQNFKLRRASTGAFFCDQPKGAQVCRRLRETCLSRAGSDSSD